MLSIDYLNDKYNANLYDWLSWLVPAAGFNPVGLPMKRKPLGSIPKPVSSSAFRNRMPVSAEVLR